MAIRHQYLRNHATYVRPPCVDSDLSHVPAAFGEVDCECALSACEQSRHFPARKACGLNSLQTFDDIDGKASV